MVASWRGIRVGTWTKRTDGPFENGWPDLPEVDWTPEFLYYRMLARRIACKSISIQGPLAAQYESEGETDISHTLALAEQQRGDVSTGRVDRDTFILKGGEYLEKDAAALFADRRIQRAIASCRNICAGYAVADRPYEINEWELQTNLASAIKEIADEEGGLPSPRLTSFFVEMWRVGTLV